MPMQASVPIQYTPPPTAAAPPPLAAAPPPTVAVVPTPTPTAAPAQTAAAPPPAVAAAPAFAASPAPLPAGPAQSAASSVTPSAPAAPLPAATQPTARTCAAMHAGTSSEANTTARTARRVNRPPQYRPKKTSLVFYMYGGYRGRREPSAVKSADSPLSVGGVSLRVSALYTLTAARGRGLQLE